MKTKIIIITNQFPYGTGETFLETEIKYWSKQKDIEVYILPLQTTNAMREIPKNIFLNHILSNKKVLKSDKIKTIIKALIHFNFYNEFFMEIIKNPKILPDSLYFYAYHLIYKNLLNQYINEHKNSKLIFYTYWFNEVTYTLQYLKNYYNFKLITRVHGYDLYQNRRVNQYIPFRKHLLQNIDKIYTITDTAIPYLESSYGFKKNILETSRLGVPDYNIETKVSSISNFHIVSCSYLIKIKNINKIINSIRELSTIKKNIHIIWTHIGSGILEQELKEYAKDNLQNINNVSYNFLGNLENQQVYEFYKTNEVDVFINVSESEGVPVSIMEAMSCHIPIIAPDVGGILDMVIDGYNGILLNSNNDVNDIVKSLNKFDFFKNQEIRNNSYQIFKQKYHALVNYTKFVKKVIG